MGDRANIQLWLTTNGYGEIVQVAPATGGCISESAVISLQDGQTLFLKQQRNPGDNYFNAEATGLAALRDACSLKIPKVIHADKGFLLLEDLGSAAPSADFWAILGQGLAELHKTPRPDFGFETDNYCGRTPQANPLTADGFTFFGQYRLLALANKSEQQGLLSTSDRQAIEVIADKLPQWVPRQRAVLIHGDLWSGNVHSDRKGQPALIDPACYWGWAEAELAMTTLFGGFSKNFYSTYESVADIAPDWRERAALYNLYHLLNHLILFGTGYLGQVQEVIDRFR